MAKCTLATLSVVLEDEILGPYREEVEEANRRGIQKTMKEMVEETKSAGFDHAYPTAGRAPGTFAKRITHTGEPVGTDGWKETWHVRAPDYRLTHLIANGHETRSGGRSKANPFIENAVSNADASLVGNIEKELGR